MRSFYDDKEAFGCKTDLDLRVYTSRLLGRDASLVLHGGGNTSVKSTVTNLLGESEEVLYVKGSGWDLATIEAEGFAPVRMDALLGMAELKELSDTDMVAQQRLAMTNPSAPNPSVEAILHAIIPFKFVDHTHADAVVTITNTHGGEEKIREIYGERVLVIPYIMPGFVLAKLVYDMTRDVVWEELDGMVLMNHGLFTFSDDGKKSYEKTIELVDAAEKYLEKNGAVLELDSATSSVELLTLAKIRKEVSNLKGAATISIFNESDLAVHFSKQDVEQIAMQGPLTPDHVIRTKRVPALLGDDVSADLARFVKEYKEYFEANEHGETLLNPAPNFAILKGRGTLSFGANAKEANIIKDINEHTFEAILKAQKLGGYKALSAKDIFEVEYWSLEQAKLKNGAKTASLSGKIAIVAGLERADMLKAQGAVVVRCDAVKSEEISAVVERAVKSFGGIDIVVADGEVFTPSSDLDTHTAHQELLKQCAPFLKLGVETLHQLFM
ncbi:class II aldolase/adducin family protein [Sulfurimonas sp.]|uniref:class II aldolase/adducin family protein n=1 Tax=Sulfurimonas sp. TaxID=2022749 RepID=UPI003D13BDC5